jgi:hypothetical protein
MGKEAMAATGFWRRVAPALLLALLAPICAEVLPGATRFSSLFVFPIETAVWGGGAVLIREIVRRRGLGWPSLLLLGMALALAEEFLIQQTSAAPLVIMLKHQVYARAGGINYLYLAWALIYEPVMVVLIPIALAELVFHDGRRAPWLNAAGATVVTLLFLIGAFLAWFTWTHIARVQVFHLPPYTPPMAIVAGSVAAIAILIVAALRVQAPNDQATPFRAILLASAGAIWSVALFGVVLMAFGIAPQIAPALPMGVALLLAAVPLALHRARPGTPYATAMLILGVLFGSMAISFVGFIGSATADLVFKIVVDAVALVLLIALVRRYGRAKAAPAAPPGL